MAWLGRNFRKGQSRPRLDDDIILPNRSKIY
jgi:hypothetical protein